MTAVEAARHLSTDHSTQWSDKNILWDFTNDVTMSILCLLESLTSEGTPSATPLSPDRHQVERPPPSLQITSNFLVFYGLSHDITLEKKCVAQNLIYSKI